MPKYYSVLFCNISFDLTPGLIVNYQNEIVLCILNLKSIMRIIVPTL